MKGKKITIFFAMILSLNFVCLPAYAAEKIIIKASTIQLANQGCGEMLTQMKSGIEGKLPGRVEMKLYLAGQLYKQTEEVAALSRGEVQMSGVVGTGSLPLISPIFQLIETPGFFKGGIETFYQVMNGPVGKEFWALAERKGIKVLGFHDAGVTSLSNKKGVEVRVPQDAAGLKIRPAGKSYEMLLRVWGALPVNVPSEEQFGALQQGVMDGIFASPVPIANRKLYEGLTNITNLGYLIVRSTGILVNKKWWDNLPADVRTVIESEATEVNLRKKNEFKQVDAEAFRQIAAGGVKVYHPTSEEFKVWEETTQKIRSALVERGSEEWLNKLSKAVREATAKGK